MKQLSVTLEIPQGEGKPDYKWTYAKEKAENVEDCRAISKGQATAEMTGGDYLTKAFNYGHDLLLRAAERSKAARAVQGPEKEIAKGIAAMVASGFDAETAKAMIIAQREAKGLPV